MTRLLLATGGTGGHVYPALAVAQATAERGFESAVIGAHGGVERGLAEGAGLPFFGVRTGKLDRQRPDPRALLRAGAGVADAVRAVRGYRPELTIGFGGFASFPGCLAAVLTGTPLVLHEQNAFPGLVTRLLAPFAHTVVLSQPAARSRLRARRVVTLPYPVREKQVPRSEARRLLGLPESGTLTLVMGGSQGSVALNRGVIESLREMRDLRPLVLHSTGPTHLEGVRAASAGISNYVARGYLDAVLAWSAADLAITRAGIGTISEAAFHGVPLIMVPLPTAAENHQLHNARAFAEAGAGRVLEQASLGDLPRLWRELLDEEPRREAAAAASRLSPAGAAEKFADLVVELTETMGARAPVESR